jgi:hypothetical protein
LGIEKCRNPSQAFLGRILVYLGETNRSFQVHHLSDRVVGICIDNLLHWFKYVIDILKPKLRINILLSFPIFRFKRIKSYPRINLFNPSFRQKLAMKGNLSEMVHVKF